MALSLKPEHLKRYLDLAKLALRYGGKDLLPAVGIDESALRDPEDKGDGPEQADGHDLAKDLEELGPTYVKLGQLLSTRADLLPARYLESLERLQDAVAPIPFADVEKTVQEELGVRLSKGFARFDDEPLAAASLAQVHRAELRDGRVVAVKVQRPGIRKVILDDLEAFDAIVELVDQHSETLRRYALKDVFQQFRGALLRELDFEREAANMKELAADLEAYPRIVVPQPIDDYCTSRVLTMDHVRGTKISAVSPLARIELDGRQLVEELTRAYLDQILVHGFFHADPHPGNVFITDDGRIALIDVGLVARLSPTQRESLLKLIVAAADGNVDDAVDVLLKLGGRRDDYDPNRFRRLVTELVLEHRNDTAARSPLGRLLIELTQLGVRCGVRPAPELSVLGKALLHLDEIGRVLDPTFNPREVIREHGQSILRRHLLKQLNPSRLLSSVLEANEFLRNLPQRLNRLFDSFSAGEFRLRVQAFDDNKLLESLQNAANRLTIAIVLGALILGAALLMRIETSFRLLGYPGLAILLFGLAAVLGFALVIHILVHDVYRRRRT